MNNLLEKCKDKSPIEIFTKSSNYGVRRIKEFRDEVLCRIFGTFSTSYNSQVLNTYTNKISKNEIGIKEINQIKYLSNQYLEHNFDLLGSGWINIHHNMKCNGIEEYYYSKNENFYNLNNHFNKSINKSNFMQSKKIASHITNNYIPIDWQLDFKSGYRWRENTFYKNISFGSLDGVDVKVPWELARMQHLTMFSWRYIIEDENEEKKKYVYEFQNQILDFISSNPPKFGVNWKCTMDVGIRAINMLLAWDMLKSNGADFDVEFEKYFSRSIYEHGKFIIQNLEWKKVRRNNHYLSNIVSLLIISAFLPETQETNTWLIFSINEFIRESSLQFNHDGSNYEASTSYHRLSLEMVLYGILFCEVLKDKKKNVLTNINKRYKIKNKLILSKNADFEGFFEGDILPDYLLKKIMRGVLFTHNLIKSNNEVVQIGDNDSGRMFKIWPTYQIITTKEMKKQYINLKHNSLALEDSELYYNENFLDHSHIINVASQIFNIPSFITATNTPETVLISKILTNKLEVSIDFTENKLKNKQNFIKIKNQIENESFDNIKTKYKFSYNKSKLNTIKYEDFGIYIYKTTELELFIRCGSNDICSGHAHNDQLSIDLTINGENLIKDSGTYLYTSIPNQRNKFRSTSYHFTPISEGKEQNRFSYKKGGVFKMTNDSKATCLYFGKEGFIGVHYGNETPVYRIIEFLEDGLLINDYGKKIKLPERVNFFSDGYGRIKIVGD